CARDYPHNLWTAYFDSW
nr:immunoglobulin heavy chain junction region [Macaca mulatta]MOV40920.1 immunoglobulin heavy chain junction region [Macaca mulatta]